MRSRGLLPGSSQARPIPGIVFGVTSRLRVLDLFAGAGGISAGFARLRKSAGNPIFEVVGAVEKDPSAAATFSKNHVGVPIFAGPIEEYRESPAADIVVGGPPCQGFSQLGKQDPEDPRNKLWNEYFAVVGRIRPAAFVLENVSRFAVSSELSAFSRRCAQAGYPDPLVLSLNAADYGVPQRRTRTIVVGHRADTPAPQAPRPTHERTPSLEGLRPWRTVGDVLAGVTTEPSTTALPPEHHTEIALWDGSRVTVPGPFQTCELHLGRNPTALSLERYRHIREGENRHALPTHLQAVCWTRHKNGSGDVMGRLRWSEPSVTIRTEFFKPEKGRYLHPTRDRPITHMEAALIQGFPPGYLWCGSKVEIARQIGNAVPVPLAEAIGSVLADCLTLLKSGTSTR